MPQRHYEGLSNPGMIVAFISASFGLLSFCSGMFVLQIDSVFAIGVIRLVLGLVYFIAAFINLLKGSGGGCINLIFAVCFGLFSGSNTIVMTFQESASTLHIPPLYGLLQIFAALYLACILPVMKRLPFYQWLGFLCAVLGLLCFGLQDVLQIAWLAKAGAIIFLLFAFINIYTGLSAILPALPQGKLWQDIARK